MTVLFLPFLFATVSCSTDMLTQFMNSNYFGNDEVLTNHDEILFINVFEEQTWCKSVEDILDLL